jgi:hypothetical protein
MPGPSPLLSALEKPVVAPLIASLEIVITGFDPVIHAVRRVDPVGGEGADGRIKFGHDDWRCPNMVPSTRLDCSEIVNRTAVGQARPRGFL